MHQRVGIFIICFLFFSLVHAQKKDPETNEPLELEEVEITVKRDPVKKSFFQPQNTVVIGSDELLKAACCNLSESFETNPAIDVNFSDAISGTKQIKMLGLTSSYILISQENIPTVRGAAQAYGLTFTPGTWIESIQITKGAGSVINGFESIGGQINTEIYKPSTTERFFANVYSSINGRNEFNIHLAQPLRSKWSTSLFVHANTRTMNVDQNEDNFMDMPRGHQVNTMSRLQYTDPEKGWVGLLTLRYLDDKKESGEIELLNNRSDLWTSTINTTRFDASMKTGYVFPLRSYQSFGIQAAFSRHDQTSNFGTSNYTLFQESFYGTLLFNSIFSNTLNTFKTGITIQYDHFDEVLNATNYERFDRSVGTFFEYTYNDIERLSFVLGARLDRHNNLGTFFTPRLNLRLNIWKDGVLRASAGQGRKASNIFAENQSALYSNRSISILGGSGAFYGLGPERATNYGLSLLQRFQWKERKGDIGIDWYRTDFINQIVVDWEKAGYLRFYNLTGRSFAENIQIDFNYEIALRLNFRSAWKNYRVRTTYDSGELDRPLTPRNRLFFNLDYSLKEVSSERNWKFDLTYHRIGSQRLPENKRDGDGFVSSPYGLINSQVTRVFGLKFEAYLGLENLGNFTQANAIVDAGNPFGPDFDASLIYAPVFGRMGYVGLRWRP